MSWFEGWMERALVTVDSIEGCRSSGHLLRWSKKERPSGVISGAAGVRLPNDIKKVPVENIKQFWERNEKGDEPQLFTQENKDNDRDERGKLRETWTKKEDIQRYLWLWRELPSQR